MNHNVTRLLIDTSKRLEPLLIAALTSGEGCRIRLSFHVQDGHLNHVKLFSEDMLGENERLSNYTTTKAVGQRVLEVINQCHRGLRFKLETALVPRWHGVVALSLEIDGGNCKIACSNEQIDKVAAERVSV